MNPSGLVARWLAMQRENMAKDTAPAAFFANGLDELRQAVQPSFSTQVGAGQNPGVWGTITTGEATAGRLEGQTMDMPKSSEKSADAWKAMLGKPSQQAEQQQENDKGLGR